MNEMGIVIVIVGLIVILFSQFKLRVQNKFRNIEEDEDLGELQSLMGMARTAMQTVGFVVLIIGVIVIFIGF